MIRVKHRIFATPQEFVTTNVDFERRSRMPLLKCPRTLQTSCLDAVCRLPQEEWDRPHIATWLPKIISGINQPHNLSANLYQALLNHLIQSEQLQSWHLHYVAHESVRCLRLDKCRNVLDNDSALLISLHCRNLQDIYINSCKQLPLLGVSFLCHHPSLTILDITGTKANDETMAILANGCPELQKLDMSSTEVTDIGLFELCGLRESGTGCKKLYRLIIHSIQVTLFGLSYVIKALKQLKQLGTDLNTGLVLYGIYHDYLMYNLPLNPLKLDYVSFSSRHMLDSLPVPASYIKALRICPNLTGLVLRSAMLANIDEEILQSLTLLKTLEVEEDEYREHTFQTVVVPFLSRIGAKMEDLTFTGFSDVDLLAVSIHCPKVDILTLENTQGFAEQPAQQVNDSAFQNLKSFFVEIAYEELQEPIRYQLGHVLKNAPNVSILHLWGVDCITDDFMTDVMKHNKFEFLRSLRLIDCPSVTRKTVEALMNAENRFAELIVDSCDKLKKTDLEELKKLAKSKNLSLTVIQGWGKPEEANNEEAQWLAM
ncbi:PREDICTED: uncharacterized protein LOC109477557 isoform X1 [Branchiostoma belcheri]|uniref:Uncharacterized protein LOC109477557 isoform X1 n=1 Tax=Branchiostoma belcheri TaxID=7741 RepID=A0A6P4ZCN6_BRABE|nr:PREDICTED: uncharacterized protein LOC109477557 isoform X1 [Branchiostoma belcheri]